MPPLPTHSQVQFTTLARGDAPVIRGWLRKYLQTHNEVWVERRGLDWSRSEVEIQLLAADLVAEHWARLLRSAQRERDTVIVARHDGEPLGCVWAAERIDDYLRTPTGVIQWLYVDPSARRRGLGEALVRDAKRWMRRRGLRSAMVSVQAMNTAAVGVYRRAGLEVADLRMMGPLDGPA